ncbi:hypothetical protein ACI797_06495 [Geodermatophilus sp. SYSU D00691]
MSSWLLVHPPLLGPATLGPLAAELRTRGNAVSVPDLRAAVDVAADWPTRWTAAAATGPADVVLGFSGAGPTLPAIAAAVGAREVVWLDAPVPARSGATAPPARVRELVAPLVRDGRIAEWTTWWGPGAFAGLVRDPALRAAIEAEGHELPADFYDVAVPLPGAWPEDGARYVQLSAAYDEDAAAAASRGWPVAGDGRGGHLDVVTDPARVADLVA